MAKEEHERAVEEKNKAVKAEAAAASKKRLAKKNWSKLRSGKAITKNRTLKKRSKRTPESRIKAMGPHPISKAAAEAGKKRTAKKHWGKLRTGMKSATAAEKKAEEAKEEEEKARKGPGGGGPAAAAAPDPQSITQIAVSLFSDSFVVR